MSPISGDAHTQPHKKSQQEDTTMNDLFTQLANDLRPQDDTTISNPMFKTLTPTEVESYRQWARENYTRMEPIRGIWHPVVQAECVKMNTE